MTVASQVKQTLAGLKGSKAGLRLYSAQTQSKEAHSIFNSVLDELDEVIDDLEERIRVLEFQEPQYKGN